MSEDNEKVEDFISLWRKKMKDDLKKPSAIGESLEIIKEVVKENEDLRSRIKENIDLISKTEEIVKNTLEENKLLKEEIKQAGMIVSIKESDIQKENIELNKNMQNLTSILTEKEEKLDTMKNEIKELKLQMEALSTAQNSITSSASSSVEANLSSEAPKTSTTKLVSGETSSAILEILVQDLQSDLNKYKRIVEKLNKEKSNNQRNIKGRGIQVEPEEIKALKRENDDLNREISKIQESLRQKTEEAATVISKDDFEKKITQLQNDLKEKNLLITDLKKASEIPASVQKTPMSSLIEDLQDRINKLKITIEEKDIEIEKLKNS